MAEGRRSWLVACGCGWSGGLGCGRAGQRLCAAGSNAQLQLLPSCRPSRTLCCSSNLLHTAGVREPAQRQVHGVERWVAAPGRRRLAGACTAAGRLQPPAAPALAAARAAPARGDDRSPTENRTLHDDFAHPPTSPAQAACLRHSNHVHRRMRCLANAARAVRASRRCEWAGELEA